MAMQLALTIRWPWWTVPYILLLATYAACGGKVDGDAAAAFVARHSRFDPVVTR
jgi:hypothetical protein